jgi:hypothetical protein
VTTHLLFRLAWFKDQSETAGVNHRGLPLGLLIIDDFSCEDGTGAKERAALQQRRVAQPGEQLPGDEDFVR